MKLTKDEMNGIWGTVTIDILVGVFMFLMFANGFDKFQEGLQIIILALLLLVSFMSFLVYITSIKTRLMTEGEYEKWLNQKNTKT